MLNKISIASKIALAATLPTVILTFILAYLLYFNYQQALHNQQFTEFWWLTAASGLILVMIMLMVIFVIRQVQAQFNRLQQAIINIANDQVESNAEPARDITTALNFIHEKFIFNRQANSIMNELRTTCTILTSGKLHARINGEYTAEFAELKRSYNDFIANLDENLSEMRQSLDAATAGDYSKRVNLINKQGFSYDLAQSINKNLDNNQNIIQELILVFTAVRNGDLSQNIQLHYTGNLAELKQSVNQSILQLNNIVSEVKRNIDAAAQGVFDSRLDVNNKSGFFKDLAETVNRNLEVNQNLVQEIMQVFAAVTIGDLSQKMRASYSGNLATLKEDVNNSVQQLNQIMAEIQDAVHASGNGIFDKRVDTTNKKGFFAAIAESLNKNLNTNQTMVEELMRVFSALAAGNLTQNMENEYSGRFAELKADVNDTVNKLNDMMGRIGSVINQVSVATEEVAQGNLSLSQRTEEQAAALEETASSMQEMTDTVRQNADNAQQANQLSLNSRSNAEEGDKVIAKTVQSMDEINKSSKQMADIISVIDEIAFQTNLLALNAAVEAARAGEQGRGFAVVATEVRNLAQRSASSAKEIKRLIQDSLTKVENGSILVTQSGKTLSDITLSVKKVSDIIAEIAAAGQEQSAGILQVNKAITQMDEMTQQNAALVEELSTNSDALREQIKMLRDLVNFFKFTVIENTHVFKKSAPKPKLGPIIRHTEKSRSALSALRYDENDENGENGENWQDF
jgi:methyl-accepting chemotaxis protein